MQLATDARIAALRIQTLLPPHIAEESDRKMDELEARMAKEDQEVRKDLEGLAALLKSGGSPDLRRLRRATPSSARSERRSSSSHARTPTSGPWPSL